MGTRERLHVRVNDELVLDAGACEEASGLNGSQRLICPPETTLFRQVLAYLHAKPDPQVRPSGSDPKHVVHAHRLAARTRSPRALPALGRRPARSEPGSAPGQLPSRARRESEGSSLLTQASCEDDASGRGANIAPLRDDDAAV